MQTALQIPVAGQNVAACLHTPQPGRAAMAPPLVVCCHGLTGSRMGSCYRFVALARKLAEENIACLRFDFRGCGESDGRFFDISIETTTADLLGVIAAADHFPHCDPTRIGIVASSFGAFTASLAAEKIPALRCLVFYAPVAFPNRLTQRDMTEAHWEQMRTQGWIDHSGLRLGAGFFEKMPETEGPDALAACPHPLLVFHGSGDRHVPIEHGRAYCEAVAGRKIANELRAIDTNDHGMRTVAANDALLEGTVAWVRRYLHPEV